MQYPRIFQHTSGTYPRPRTNSLWRNSFHLGVWGGLGYAPGVCWGSLRQLYFINLDFPEIKGPISLPHLPFGVRSCEVAIIWPEPLKVDFILPSTGWRDFLNFLTPMTRWKWAANMSLDWWSCFFSKHLSLPRKKHSNPRPTVGGTCHRPCGTKKACHGTHCHHWTAKKMQTHTAWEWAAQLAIFAN